MVVDLEASSPKTRMGGKEGLAPLAANQTILRDFCPIAENKQIVFHWHDVMVNVAFVYLRHFLDLSICVSMRVILDDVKFHFVFVVLASRP